VIRLPEDVRSSLRFFAFYLANGTVDMELLADVDYRPELMRYGSDLERVFAIFSNVLEVDEEGNVTNLTSPSGGPRSGSAVSATLPTRSCRPSRAGRSSSCELPVRRCGDHPVGGLARVP
jgi:hypothetical protein